MHGGGAGMLSAALPHKLLAAHLARGPDGFVAKHSHASHVHDFALHAKKERKTKNKAMEWRPSIAEILAFSKLIYTCSQIPKLVPLDTFKSK